METAKDIEKIILDELEHRIWQICDAADTNDAEFTSKMQMKLEEFLEELPDNNRAIADGLIEQLEVFDWPELVLALYNHCAYIITKEEYEHFREQWPDLRPKICENIERRFEGM